MIKNLPDSHKDKKEYLLSLKDSIDIPIVCIRCKKYGHHVSDSKKEEKAKKEKDKKEKIKIKQDKNDIRCNDNYYSKWQNYLNNDRLPVMIKQEKTSFLLF